MALSYICTKWLPCQSVYFWTELNKTPYNCAKLGDKNLQLTYKTHQTPNPRSLGQNLVYFCRSFANYNFQKCLFSRTNWLYVYYMAALSKVFHFWTELNKTPYNCAKLGDKNLQLTYKTQNTKSYFNRSKPCLFS